MNSHLKFRMTNIGVVKEAEIELADFTVIVGKNNTGKTHIAYTIYGFLRGFREIMLSEPFEQSLDEHFNRVASHSTEQIVDLLNTTGRVEWALTKDDLEKERASLLNEMARIYAESGLPSVFSTSQDSFRNTSLDVKFEYEASKDAALDYLINRKGKVLSLEYDGFRFVVSLTGGLEPEDTVAPIDPHLTEFWLKWLYPYFILDDPIKWGFDPFVLSTQRFSVSLFYKELDTKRSDIVRLLQQEEENMKEGRILSPESVRQTSRYSLPIHDNIDFVRDLPNYTRSDPSVKNAGVIADLENLVKGRYKLEDESILFTSTQKSEEDFEIPLHLASSAGGELSLMYLYLRHFYDGHNILLIIDEPECHLDTANQIEIARILARLVNSGTKVLITTHSDYIMKEINNLIMLSSSFSEKEETKRRFGYQKDDYLNPDSIRAYVAEEQGLTPCPRDKFGIDLPVFDKTIEHINQVSNSLYAQLNEEPEEA